MGKFPGFLVFIQGAMKYGSHSQELPGRDSTGATGDQMAASPGHREKSDLTVHDGLSLLSFEMP